MGGAAGLCCIVGGGPAGVMLAFLLARRGVEVVLLEAQDNFDRDFRGDSINPSVMNIMDQLGLGERLHQLPHSKIASVSLRTPHGVQTVTDYGVLKSKYPYITMMPQVQFLDFVADEARRLPNCRIEMNARVRELIVEDGVVRGVRYQKEGVVRELRAALVVGADGRGSKVRRMADMPLAHRYPKLYDVLWFRLPLSARIPADANMCCYMGKGFYFALCNRFDYWQVAYVAPTGHFRELRTRDIGEFKRSILEIAPELEESIASLTDWKTMSLLSVEIARVAKWHRPGLLLIGDAAHVMSSAGGVGISEAIHDAVVAANVLATPLRAGRVETRHLAAVQRKRAWKVRMMQALQRMSERGVVARALDQRRSFSVPLSMRLPFVKRIAAAVVAYGIHLVPLRVEQEGATAPAQAYDAHALRQPT